MDWFLIIVPWLLYIQSSSHESNISIKKFDFGGKAPSICNLTYATIKLNEVVTSHVVS